MTKHVCLRCGKDCGGCSKQAYQCLWLFSHTCEGKTASRKALQFLVDDAQELGIYEL